MRLFGSGLIVSEVVEELLGLGAIPLHGRPGGRAQSQVRDRDRRGHRVAQCERDRDQLGQGRWPWSTVIADAAPLAAGMTANGLASVPGDVILLRMPLIKIRWSCSR